MKETMLNNRLHINDVVSVIFLILFTALFAFTFVDFSIAPFEDAAMLMRYAEHFAQGYGIVWNIGEKPVDGATDFLFMVVLGLFTKAGMPLEFATRFIGFSSHVVTVVIVYWASRKYFLANLIPALVTAIYLAMGPGLHYVAAYFGTPFFALFACITWYMALNIIVNGESRIRSLFFAVAALVTALIRPEGVILTGLMMLGIVYISGVKRSLNTIRGYLGIFFVCGGAYFLWRWHYFGFPLPNPFYKKGGGSIYLDSLVGSLKNTIHLCLPFLPAFIMGFYSSKTIRMTIGVLIPIVGFALAFVMISDEMNYGARFQYALLPIILMSWWPLVRVIKDDWPLPLWSQLNLQKKMTLILLAIVLSIGMLGYTYMVGRIKCRYFRDGRYNIASLLADYKDRHFAMATTEAGLLPLYSRWNAMDTWGLNDPWIAHNGRITEAYLGALQPHVVMFHASFSPLVSCQGTGAWFEMVMTMKRYVEKNGYVLAAVFGENPYDTHYYYVRSDFSESKEISSRIQTTEYFWHRTGRKAINYALLTTK